MRFVRLAGADTLSSGYGTNLGESAPFPFVSFRLFNYHQEGPWHEVTKAIHDCHAAVHAKGAPRIATDIRIGTRVDEQITPGEGNGHKVARVLEILAKDNAS